jgi:rubrerythrin
MSVETTTTAKCTNIRQNKRKRHYDRQDDSKREVENKHEGKESPSKDERPELYSITYLFDNPQTSISFKQLEFFLHENCAYRNIRYTPGPHFQCTYIQPTSDVEISITDNDIMLSVDSRDMLSELHVGLYPELIATLIACGASPSTCASIWVCTPNVPFHTIPVDDIRGSGSSVWMRLDIPHWDRLTIRLTQIGGVVHSDMHERTWIEWHAPHRAFEADASLQTCSSLTSEVDVAYIYEDGAIRLRTGGTDVFTNAVIEKLHMKVLLIRIQDTLPTQVAVHDLVFAGTNLYNLMRFYCKRVERMSLTNGQLVVERKIFDQSMTVVISRKGRFTYTNARLGNYASSDAAALAETFNSIFYYDVICSNEKHCSVDFAYQRNIADQQIHKSLLNSEISAWQERLVVVLRDERSVWQKRVTALEAQVTRIPLLETNATQSIRALDRELKNTSDLKNRLRLERDEANRKTEADRKHISELEAQVAQHREEANRKTEADRKHISELEAQVTQHREETRSLIRRLEVAETAQLCSICLVSQKNVLFWNCGHLALCNECAQTVNGPSGDKKCPFCRAPIVEMSRVFM